MAVAHADQFDLLRVYRADEVKQAMLPIQILKHRVFAAGDDVAIIGIRCRQIVLHRADHSPLSLWHMGNQGLLEPFRRWQVFRFFARFGVANVKNADFHDRPRTAPMRPD